VRRLKVFVSSPGDVQNERLNARSVLLDLPLHRSFRGRVHVEPVLYDEAGDPTLMPANTSPQESVIDAKPTPAECDLTIVIVRSRLGTALPERLDLPDGYRCRSGTEWEYRSAVDAGKPVFVFYNPEAPAVRLDARDLADRQAQLASAQDFIRGLKSRQSRRPRVPERRAIRRTAPAAARGVPGQGAWRIPWGVDRADSPPSLSQHHRPVRRA
jgi:hypothetical protein